jgi:hypothetical protein
MLFPEKAQSSMQQEDKLKCIWYTKNVPRGGMNLLSIQISMPIWTSILSSFILIGRSKNRCSHNITMLQAPNFYS